MSIKPLRWVVLVACIAQLVMNSVGTTIFGYEENYIISNRYMTEITPADYTFAVWGPIFLGAIIYTLYQLLPSTQNNRLIDRITPYAIAAYTACAIWPLLFGFWWFISAQIMIGIILIALAGAYVVLRNTEVRRQLTVRETWLIKVPFTIYFAWVTVANVVGLSLTLIAQGWSGFGISSVVWAVVVLLAVLIVTSGLIAYGRGNLAYAVITVWAMIGIINNTTELPVVVTAGVVAAVAALVGIVTRMRRPNRNDSIVRPVQPV